MAVILDACAIIAYLRKEDGADLVASALLSDDCLAHAMNLCEVYKDCLSRGESRELQIISSKIWRRRVWYVGMIWTRISRSGSRRSKQL